MDDESGHRKWMREQLRIAADHFEMEPVGDVKWGWRDRTIGSRARSAAGDRWLRASWATLQWTKGDYWTGNDDARVIVDVSKPAVLGLHEWGQDNYRVRAELMNLVSDPACSTSPELRSEITVPEHWWADLRASLAALAKVPTERGNADQNRVTRRLLMFFGDRVDPTVHSWQTAHGDLDWTNLTAPNLVLLDWESWGRKPAGYDAANLYVLALLAPDTAKQLHDTFADVLDSPAGILAQLYAITRYLRRVEHGDFLDYAGHLHAHARTLLG